MLMLKNKNTTKVLNFRVLVEQDEKGTFIATAPAIPGCHTQGETYEETMTNIKEAIKLCLEVARENPSYKEKIDFAESEDEKMRFLGVVQVPVNIRFAI